MLQVTGSQVPTTAVAQLLHHVRGAARMRRVREAFQSIPANIYLVLPPKEEKPTKALEPSTSRLYGDKTPISLSLAKSTLSTNFQDACDPSCIQPEGRLDALARAVALVASLPMPGARPGCGDPSGRDVVRRSGITLNGVIGGRARASTPRATARRRSSRGR
jgi:hypothetical protein